MDIDRREVRFTEAEIQIRNFPRLEVVSTHTIELDGRLREPEQVVMDFFNETEFTNVNLHKPIEDHDSERLSNITDSETPTKGFPDLVAENEQFEYDIIEVKKEGDGLRLSQIDYMKETELSCAVVHISTSDTWRKTRFTCNECGIEFGTAECVLGHDCAMLLPDGELSDEFWIWDDEVPEDTASREVRWEVAGYGPSEHREKQNPFDQITL